MLGGTSSTRATSVLGLTGLVLHGHTYKFLSADAINDVCERITTLAVSDIDPEVRARSVSSLVSIARVLPEAVLARSLPVFMQRIPVQSSEGTPSDEATVYRTLASLCVAPVIFDSVAKKLLEIIEQVLHEVIRNANVELMDTSESNSQPVAPHTRHHDQAKLLFECLANAVTQNVSDTSSEAETLVPSLIATLINYVTNPHAANPSHSTHHSLEHYLPHCVRVVRTVAQRAEEDAQTKLFNKMTSIKYSSYRAVFFFDTIRYIFTCR